MNQQQKPTPAKPKPTPKDNPVEKVAAASNGFNQVAGAGARPKQYGMNAVPTSRKAQLANQYGQQKQVKSGDS